LRQPKTLLLGLATGNAFPQLTPVGVSEKSPNRLRVVLTLRPDQGIQPLKGVRALDFHVPIVISPGPDNGYTPIAGPIGKCVFNRGNKFCSLNRIPRIVYLDCDRHTPECT